MGFPVQLPPTDDEQATMCICKPHPTPSPPIPSPILSPSPSPSPSPNPTPPLLNFTVLFKDITFSGSEADGSIAVTVVATGVSPFPYNVTIMLSEFDQVSSGELPDYSDDTIVLTFNPGDTEKTALIAVNPDCEIEGSEFFNLTLSLGPSTVTPGIFLGDPSEAAAEIEDTESKYISYTLCNECAYVCTVLHM